MALAGALLRLTCPPAEAARLHGQIDIKEASREPLYAESPYSYRPPSLAAGRPPASPGAIVYLEALEGRLPPSANEGRASIDQRQETFVPHILPVSVGTRVAFPNNDSIFHNVFSLSRAKRFDLGRYPQGESRSVLFDREGVVRVFCEIHSHMSAFVVVLPHSFYDATDGAGRYRIENIPAGRYRVVAWHDRLRPRAKEIELSPEDDVRIDFVLDQAR